ncbi:MAG: hypothetical protein QOI42_966, partial [Frankiaceae bacterium]|nr:hypothetical protein [Frankiaceae bacterium]
MGGGADTGLGRSETDRYGRGGADTGLG